MELVEAETLEAALAQGPFTARRALQVALQIGAALQATHVRRVIHCDLKPSNVFLGPRQRVKIGDFGAAKVLSSHLGQQEPPGLR